MDKVSATEREPIIPSNERKKLNARQIGGVLCATVALSSVMMGATGCSRQKTVGELTKQPVAEAPVSPDEAKVPKEAEEFVANFGDRYDDPVSTYYAEQAYKNINPRGSIIETSSALAYDLEGLRQDKTSELGFEIYELPLDAEINNKLSIDIFNNYTAKQLTTYMNLLARNPDNKDMLDHEFELFCSFVGNTNPNMAGSDFTEDDDKVINLMETVGYVVEKYGSTATYAVTNASEGASDDISTSFHPNEIILGTENNGIIDRFQSAADIVIRIDTFKDGESTEKYETLQNIELTVIRGPYNPAFSVSTVSIGQVK